MTVAEDALLHAARLTGQARPYALATVVRVERPSSTRRGDHAVVTPDGALMGWIGGACAQPVVVREALRALADGEPRLVRIGPGGAGAEGAAPEDDLVVAAASCASEGTVEVLVEPHLPAPLLAVVGDAPAGRTLAALAREIGWRVAEAIAPDVDAVVVATMGRSDEEALTTALATQAGYVGVVASARRAATLCEALRAAGHDAAAVARVRGPAGLDLGPSNQSEIAVAILAELVAWRHLRAGVAPPDEAVDPVCGMTVGAAAATEIAVHDEVTYRFCSAGCRRRFEAAPAHYAGRVVA